MKCHLVDSHDPLKSGGKLTANCGVEIRNAEFAFMFDLELVPGEFSSSLMCCRKCQGTRTAKRYIYGVVNGQETKGAAA